MKNSLIGSWELVSFTIDSPDEGGKPWGKNARGLLIYAHTGHMSVSINRDPENTGNPVKDAFDAVLFYAGTYSLDGNIVHHKVSLASDLSRVGKDMIRFASFQGDKVTLTTPKESYGIATVIWRKIK